IDDRHAVSFEPIAERESRMIQVLGGDAHATDCQCSLAEIVITDRRGQLREGDRKIWMLHLRGQNCFEALAQAARRVEIPLAALGRPHYAQDARSSAIRRLRASRTPPSRGGSS